MLSEKVKDLWKSANSCSNSYEHKLLSVIFVSQCKMRTQTDTESVVTFIGHNITHYQVSKFYWTFWISCDSQWSPAVFRHTAECWLWGNRGVRAFSHWRETPSLATSTCTNAPSHWRERKMCENCICFNKLINLQQNN